MNFSIDRVLPRCCHALASMALLVLPLGTKAECSVGFSSLLVDLGDTAFGTDAEADVPGYRRIGNSRAGILTVLCDADRAALQLVFGNVVSGSRGLLKWDATRQAGAMQLRVTRATADGVQVNIVGADGTRLPGVNIVKDGEVITLDLTPLQKGARSFMLEVQMTGLVEKSFVPTMKTGFSMTPRVQLLNP